MNDDDDRRAVIDHRRSVSLRDVGGGNFAATVAIDGAGVEYLLVVFSGHVGSSIVYDPSCSTVAHEQLGELPAHVVLRIGRADG